MPMCPYYVKVRFHEQGPAYKGIQNIQIFLLNVVALQILVILFQEQEFLKNVAPQPVDPDGFDCIPHPFAAPDDDIAAVVGESTAVIGDVPVVAIVVVVDVLGTGARVVDNHVVASGMQVLVTDDIALAAAPVFADSAAAFAGLPVVASVVLAVETAVARVAVPVVNIVAGAEDIAAVDIVKTEFAGNTVAVAVAVEVFAAAADNAVDLDVDASVAVVY